MSRELKLRTYIKGNKKKWNSDPQIFKFICLEPSIIRLNCSSYLKQHISLTLTTFVIIVIMIDVLKVKLSLSFVVMAYLNIQ